MKKKAQALIMALIMLFTTIAVPLMDSVSVSASEDALTVQFHYLREDGNYDGWDVTAWDGASNCEFQKDGDQYVTDENGAVAETLIQRSLRSSSYLLLQQ